MTQSVPTCHNPTREEESSATSRASRHASKVTRWLLGFSAVALLSLAPEVADAKPRCATKPAVCAYQKAQKQRAEQRAAQKPAKVHEVKRSALDARCLSKPAVCNRTGYRSGVGVAPKAAPSQVEGVQRCDSKPAVCARLRAQRSR